MNQLPVISVIIPCSHVHHELLRVVKAICFQTVRPAEIVIVNSSEDRNIFPVTVAKLCAVSSIKLIYESRALALPGYARNIGLGLTNAELIAFIDVQTIPHSYWLETILSQLSKNDAAGVWGSTGFSAETEFEKLVRDGFYGVLPRKTLPGSIFRRNVFETAGHFIGWVRAGEDTEWMKRLELLKLPIAYQPMILTDYVGLIGLKLRDILKKWYRNYHSSRELPHFYPQKILMWLILYPLLVLIAFNWNYLIADWQIDSPLYIGHVTKTAAILPLLAYAFGRGILLPMHRGVGIWQLLPIRFIAIILICLIADLVKIMVFTLPKFEQ
jgi:hypothetical protein